MVDRVNKHGLKVDSVLENFIESEALPGTNISSESFWKGFSKLIKDLSIKNKSLLEKREKLQSQIDNWHIERKGKPHDKESYISFLKEIGYLVPEGPKFNIETSNIDPEIANISGPQLVVPIMNARYALNAANARWGSFYDAIYGTDVMGDLPPDGGYNADRGTRVIIFAKDHLDEITPLVDCSWKDITNIEVINNDLHLTADKKTSLINPDQFIGFIKKDNKKLAEIILVKNGLHIRILINSEHPIGKSDPANISDILLESAMTTIMDCEDSVAAVDSEDKVVAYRNWLGLMKGDLSEEFVKNNQTINRKLNGDVEITTPTGKKHILKGRSLMLNRNVGHLMTNPAVLDHNNNEIGEGLLDAICTTLIAIHDLKKIDGIRNTEKGSVYIVKPKLKLWGIYLR